MAHIKSRLQAHRPLRFSPKSNTRQAAVAVVLRERDNATEVLFIKRAEKAGDPWSGHMAFPGGHLEPQDADLTAAAMRETHEEIGLVIERCGLIGELSQQRAAPRGRPLNMLVAPYVFEIHGDPSFDLNFEVDEVVWTQLAPMHTGDNHTIENRPVAGTPTSFNGFRLAGGHFVWGLTYRMVQSFFEVLDPDYVGRD